MSLMRRPSLPRPVWDEPYGPARILKNVSGFVTCYLPDCTSRRTRHPVPYGTIRHHTAPYGMTAVSARTVEPVPHQAPPMARVLSCPQENAHMEGAMVIESVPPCTGA